MSLPAVSGTLVGSGSPHWIGAACPCSGRLGDRADAPKEFHEIEAGGLTLQDERRYGSTFSRSIPQQSQKSLAGRLAAVGQMAAEASLCRWFRRAASAICSRGNTSSVWGGQSECRTPLQGLPRRGGRGTLPRRPGHRTAAVISLDRVWLPDCHSRIFTGCCPAASRCAPRRAQESFLESRNRSLTTSSPPTFRGSRRRRPSGLKAGGFGADGVDEFGGLLSPEGLHRSRFPF